MTFEEFKKEVDYVTYGNTTVENGELIRFTIRVSAEYVSHTLKRRGNNLQNPLYNFCEHIRSDTSKRFPEDWKERAKEVIEKLNTDYPERV